MSTHSRKTDPTAKDRNMIFILALVTLAGFIISMIFGTWGLATTVTSGESTSALGKGIIGLISFAAMLSINLNQFAKILEERPSRSLIHYVEAFLYYAVDWTMTFAGFGGWSMLNEIIGGNSSLSTNIYMGLLIALAAVGAGFTAYGTEVTLKELLKRVGDYNKIEPDFRDLQKNCYSMSGWLALGVSWAAACFGVINIAAFAGADMAYAPSKVAIGAAAILLPVIFSGVEYWLLKEEERSTGQNAVLWIFWTLDGATIFGGLGGIALVIEMITGSVNGETMAIIITALVSKIFTAYLGAIGAETSHVDAENVFDDEDHEPAFRPRPHRPGTPTPAPAPHRPGTPTPAPHRPGTPAPTPTPAPAPRTPPEDQIVDGPLEGIQPFRSLIYPGWAVQKPDPMDQTTWVYFRLPTRPTPPPTRPSEPSYHPVGPGPHYDA